MTDSSDILQFVLDDCIVAIDFSQQKDIRPSTTVLKYLRSLESHKGVKEGCGEGDCGACTVVVAETGNDGRLKYKAINSCLLFLPVLHGKQLITVENLALKKNGEKILHPVQQALVEMGGSQCGYCTPGIVMSMFALYKNNINPSLETIQDALTGNLCRCTGYQSVIDASIKACAAGNDDHFSENEHHVISLLHRINSSSQSLCFRSPEQRYYKPSTVNDIFDIIEKDSSVILVNGATDIAVRQTKKHEFFKCIIDISGVHELCVYKESNGVLIFGAGVSMEVVRGKVKDIIPAFYDLLDSFASLQIRNVATLGGNIGSASPIGDTIPLLFALKAEIMIKSREGLRTLPVEEFIMGYRKTALLQGEIIYQIIIPVPPKVVELKSYKVSKRRTLDISTVSGAFRLETDINAIVTSIILAFGGVAPVTMRALKTEKFLYGKTWDENTIEKASSVLYEEFTPISDARGGDEFRRVVTANLLLKFYQQTKKNIFVNS